MKIRAQILWDGFDKEACYVTWCSGSSGKGLTLKMNMRGPLPMAEAVKLARKMDDAQDVRSFLFSLGMKP